MSKVLTPKVRHGLSLIEAEMDATADTMLEDRPDEAEAIRLALHWIRFRVAQLDKKRFTHSVSALAEIQ